MIPKIIHYCWFGGAPKSNLILSCIETWGKHFPEYDIVCWSEKNFDVNSVKFVKQAYEHQKWAFVSDYVRLYALYHVGGIYFDTDVEVLKRFPDQWNDYAFYSGLEIHPDLFSHKGNKKLTEDYTPLVPGTDIDGFSVFSAVMASAPHHVYVGGILEEYKKLDFVNSENQLNMDIYIIGAVITRFAERLGFVYRNEFQLLEDGVALFPADVLVGNSSYLTNDSFALHHANGSWVQRSKIDQFFHNVKNGYPQLYPYLSLFYKAWRRFKSIL